MNKRGAAICAPVLVQFDAQFCSEFNAVYILFYFVIQPHSNQCLVFLHIQHITQLYLTPVELLSEPFELCHLSVLRIKHIVWIAFLSEQEIHGPSVLLEVAVARNPYMIVHLCEDIPVPSERLLVKIEIKRMSCYVRLISEEEFCL